MSNRACNYCVFQLIKKSAEKEGKTVKTESKDGGVDVFVDGKWRCWFMELPDSCRC